MKINIIGKTARQSVNQNTGAIRIYTNLFYYTDFSDYERQNGADGFKVGTINTSLDCSKVSVGSWYNANYEPTGYTTKDSNGNNIPQFALCSLEPIKE